MVNVQNSKRYDLEGRTLNFSKRVRGFASRLPRTVANSEDIRQLVRSSGSIGANYIEANESLGKRDFLMKIRICRKEAKETGYWLKLLDLGSQSERERDDLLGESIELMKIFGSIIEKSSSKPLVLDLKH